MSRTRGSARNVSESLDVILEDLEDFTVMDLSEADEGREILPNKEDIQVAVSQSKVIKLKKLKKSKKMTRKEFEALMYKEFASKMSNVRVPIQEVLQEPSGLDDFDSELEDWSFSEDEEEKNPTVLFSKNGLQDFAGSSICHNGNILFAYDNLLEKSSNVNLFRYVINLKVRDLQVGNVIPVIKGESWEKAIFIALFKVTSSDGDPVILEMISPRVKECILEREMSISFPVINVFALNTTGLSKITEKSLDKKYHISELISASLNGRKDLNLQSFRFGNVEDYSNERSSTSGSSSAIQKDAMLVIDKLLNKNKSIINKVFYMANNIDSIPSKLSILKKIPKFFLLDSPPGLSIENIRVLVFVVNGLKPSMDKKKFESFHLSSLLKWMPYTFKSTFTVKLTFEMYIEILGVCYEDRDLFISIFKNVTIVFVNSTRNIMNVPVQCLVDLLSRILVTFSLILRNPNLESCSQQQLIDVCQRELFIDENAFLLETLTERGSIFQDRNFTKRKFSDNDEQYHDDENNYKVVNNNYVNKGNGQNKGNGNGKSNFKVKVKNNNNKVKNVKSNSLCYRQLGFDLKVSSDKCPFEPNCQFNHVTFPNPVSDSWKIKIKDQVNGLSMIKDKQRYVDAINGL